ncbi:MAG: clostripain-related cysteine peptidase [Ardenticatenaceae bacterium]
MKQATYKKGRTRPLGLVAALLLMLLLPATLAYGAYLPLPSSPNALDADDDGAKASQNRAPELTFDCTTVSEIPQTECEALVALYESTDGANWTDNSGWLNTTTPCGWYGLTCSGGRISELSMHNNQLSGSIPPELGNLANLTHLNLRSNELSGSIPAELGNLANLTSLWLYNNQLSGSIPAQLGNLANLTSLWLYNNQLSGSIPPELGNLANLTNLALLGNLLSGSIPPELGNLANLTQLSVYNNQLSGPIPPELGNLANLTKLYLYRNQLSGTIPPELGNLANLTHLNLYSNQLSGSIPPELANLTNLTHLALSYNRLSGTILPELGQLANLTHLLLTANELSGTIPPELGNLANLTVLNLHTNQLSGSIPLAFTNLNSLSTFYFHQTNLCEPNTTAFQSWLSGVGDVSSTNVTCAPRLVALTPNSAVANAGNVPVIINASDLGEPVTARLGNVDLLDVTLENANTLHAVVPVGSLSEGTHDLAVESAGQTLTLTDTFTVEPEVAPTQFLAMVYLACDNNLASSCRRLFNNLELAMTNNPNLRIAAFWDGQAYGDSAFYLVQADDNPYLWASYDDSNRVSLGEMDSADPGTLVQFTAWAQSQYPGQYNFLSLVDHGSGWAPDLYPGQKEYKWIGGVGGMFWDDTSHNVMSTQALAGALKWISDGNSLNALYIDACQMGTVEVMAELAPYAQYVIAHENLAWATYPYDQYFNGMDGNTTPSALAQQIAQVNRDSWPTKGHPTHIAVVNSSQMDNALSKLDALANQLLSKLSDDQVRLAIDDVVRNTAHVDENTDFRINSEDSAIDLYHFASQLNAHATIPTEVKSAAQELMSALDDTIEANYTHNDTPWPGSEAWDLSNLHGLSVYFPLADEWKRNLYGTEALPTFASASRWDDFIQAWHNQDAPEPPTEPCPGCLIPPMHTALTIGTPQSALVGQPVWVPVRLSGVETEDDVRGVQITVQVTDTNILAPADDLEPRLGDLFPDDSYTYAVHSSNGKGWDYILTDVGDSESQAVSGEGIIVELPFYSQTEGCVYVEFSEHLLSNHKPEAVNHHHAGNWICTNDRGTLSGRAYLQSRNPGAYDQIRVAITGPRESYTTTTDVNGNYTFLNIYQDEYNMTFTHIASVPLFAQRTVTNVSVNAGGTTTLDVGLWAGDIDQDGDVDGDDETLLEAATIPVDFPSFDINADGQTNVFDLIILQNNKGRPNLTTTNPLQGRAGTVARRAADTNNPQPYVVTNDTPRHFRLPAHANQEMAITLRAEVITGTLESIGTRLALPAGATVTDIELAPAFAGGNLFWEQVEDKLYIVAAPEETVSEDADMLTIRMNVTDGEATVTVEAVNKVAWDGELIVPDAIEPEPEPNLLYLPIITR